LRIARIDQKSGQGSSVNQTAGRSLFRCRSRFRKLQLNGSIPI
jgi:hypothetical protein